MKKFILQLLVIFITLVVRPVNSFSPTTATSAFGISHLMVKSARHATTSSINTNRKGNFNRTFSTGGRVECINDCRAKVYRALSSDYSETDPTTMESDQCGVYKCLSIAYILQIVMALKKSGLALTSANAIVGPGVAGTLAFILGNSNSSSSIYTNNDVPSKLMNGTLLLYSMLCLLLAGLASVQQPLMASLFGRLYVLTGLSTFVVSAKGYSYSISSTKKDDGDKHDDAFSKTLGGRGVVKGILQTTKEILPRIHRANLYAIPRDMPNVLYMICMVATIGLKTDVLMLHFLPARTDLVPIPTTSMIGLLAKYSLIGGSIVTLRDAANQKILEQRRFVNLNLCICYAFVIFAALRFVQDATTALLPTSFGYLLGISALACFKNAFSP